MARDQVAGEGTSPQYPVHPKRGDTDERSPSIQQLQLSRPVDFPNTLPRLYRQDVPSRRQSRSHETFDLKVPDLKPTRTDGREDPMKSRGIKEYASLGCIFDRAYRPRPDSVALRHRDALFSGPAKDTETLHVPVVHPGIRRLITVLRASHICSPEAVYFRRNESRGQLCTLAVHPRRPRGQPTTGC